MPIPAFGQSGQVNKYRSPARSFIERSGFFVFIWSILITFGGNKKIMLNVFLEVNYIGTRRVSI